MRLNNLMLLQGGHSFTLLCAHMLKPSNWLAAKRLIALTQQQQLQLLPIPPVMLDQSSSHIALPTILSIFLWFYLLLRVKYFRLCAKKFKSSLTGASFWNVRDGWNGKIEISWFSDSIAHTIATPQRSAVFKGQTIWTWHTETRGSELSTILVQNAKNPKK